MVRASQPQQWHSLSDVLAEDDRRAETQPTPATSPPIVVAQPTTPVDQSPSPLVDQSPSPPEGRYPSRYARRKKGVRLPINKLERYETWCFLHKMDFQDAVEMAMDWLVSQGTGRPDDHVLNDELDEKLDDEVIIYYQRVTGNKVTSKDREAREEARNYTVEVCKIGILTSVLRAKVKINSFRYCLGAIEEIAAAPLQGTQDYLRYLEQAFSKKDAGDKP
jgi:hypothetical protein